MAINIAKTNKNKFKFGCVVLDKRGNIVAHAKNSMSKTHPIQEKFARRIGRPDAKFLHSEMRALIRAKCDVHTLIVVRLLADGKMGLAKPCKICSSAIDFAGVKNVLFSNEFGKITWEKR